MTRTIEADFFLPAVEPIDDTSRALTVDTNHDAAHSAEPVPNKTNRSSAIEASQTNASSRRADSSASPVVPRGPDS